MIPAILAGWTLQKLTPYLIVGAGSAVVGFGLAWWLQSDRVAGVKDQLAAMTTMHDMAQQDARRWHQAAEDRRVIIEQRNAEIEAARADLKSAEAILVTADMVAKAEAEDLNAEIRKWKERARANPQDVRPIGPIARDAIGVLVAP